MTRRLVAAFVLGGLCAATALWYSHLSDTVPGRIFDQCLEDVDALSKVCNERIDDADLYGQRLFCRLREAERLLQPLYPEWRGYFAERDRRQYDEEYGCGGPEMAPHEWTIEELESNAELGGSR